MSKRLFVLSIVIVMWFAAFGAWKVFQWRECRDLGFSVFYCVQHIL